MNRLLLPSVTLGGMSLSQVMFWAVLIICLSVGLHALVMRVLYARFCHGGKFAWLRLSMIVVVLLATHVLQIVLFGVAYHVLPDSSAGLEGAYDGSLADGIYFSAAVYTTVGFGDITPMSHLRLMVALEALAGLVLIAWSASFTFVAMSKLAQPTDESSEELAERLLPSEDDPAL